SSLSRLNEMPATTLKIDRSFVANLTQGNAGGLVGAMIQMAEPTGLQPVAEGIETEEQRAFLLELGCPLGQGYLFSRPVPAEALERMRRGSRAARQLFAHLR